MFRHIKRVFWLIFVFFQISLHVKGEKGIYTMIELTDSIFNKRVSDA